MLGGGGADDVAGGDGEVEVEGFEDGGGDVGFEGFPVFEGEFVEGDVAFFRKSDGVADDFVGFAEGDAGADEGVGNVCGEEVGVGGGLAATDGVDSDVRDHGGKDFKA